MTLVRVKFFLHSLIRPNKRSDWTGLLTVHIPITEKWRKKMKGRKRKICKWKRLLLYTCIFMRLARALRPFVQTKTTKMVIVNVYFRKRFPMWIFWNTAFTYSQVDNANVYFSWTRLTSQRRTQSGRELISHWWTLGLPRSPSLACLLLGWFRACLRTFILG